MTYKTEFPDFPVSAIPADIPAAWRDSSWKNDACPSFTVCGPEVTSARLVMWINWPDLNDREFPGASYMLADGYGETLLETDDWSEAREVAECHRLAYAFALALGDVMTPKEWRAMRERNTRVAPGVCASHDFRDSNMDMAEAYESVYGESVFGNDGHVTEKAQGRWNHAWAIATPRYLTANDSAARVFDQWRTTRGGSLSDGFRYGPGLIGRDRKGRHVVTVSNYSEAFDSLFEAELILWELFAQSEWESE